MDAHEDLVALNRAHIDAHLAEVARLASGEPDVALAPEDQAVADAQDNVVKAQAELIAAQQAAYNIKNGIEVEAETEAAEGWKPDEAKG